MKLTYTFQNWGSNQTKDDRERMHRLCKEDSKLARLGCQKFHEKECLTHKVTVQCGSNWSLQWSSSQSYQKIGCLEATIKSWGQTKSKFTDSWGGDELKGMITRMNGAKQRHHSNLTLLPLSLHTIFIFKTLNFSVHHPSRSIIILIEGRIPGWADKFY